MSGNIKYIGKNNNTATQLPTSGFGYSVSNSDSKENALKKFASSFTNNKTKESMINSFTSENGLVDIITKNANNPKVLNEVLEVKQTPLDNKDCSVYTISPINSSIENSVSTNPLSSEGLLVRDNGEEINSLKEENHQLKEQTLMQTNEMAQKMNEMLNKKQVEIAELQSQLQLKQEGEKDVVLLLEKEVKLLKLFEDKMDLYRLRNEIGTKVNMDLQKTINSMKTLLETTKQTREQVSQSDFQPSTVEIDTALSQSDSQPSTVEIMEKSATALLEAENIIAEFEKQSKNEEAAAEPPIVVATQLPKNVAKTVPSYNKTKTISEKQKLTFVNRFEIELNAMDKEIDKGAKEFVLRSIESNDSLDEKFKNALELYRKIHSGIMPNFNNGGKSRRHGKRIKSRKPRALKNKTKTRRYRKRSFTRRRK